MFREDMLTKKANLEMEQELIENKIMLHEALPSDWGRLEKILKKLTTIEREQNLIEYQISRLEAPPYEWKRLQFDNIAPMSDIIKFINDNKGD